MDESLKKKLKTINFLMLTHNHNTVELGFLITSVLLITLPLL